VRDAYAPLTVADNKLQAVCRVAVNDPTEIQTE
jgi:hypothetical protein